MHVGVAGARGRPEMRSFVIARFHSVDPSTRYKYFTEQYNLSDWDLCRGVEKAAIC